MLAAPYTSPKGWIPDVGLAALGYGVGALTGAGPLMAGLPPLLNLARKGYQATNAAKTISAADTLHNVGFTRMTPEMRAQLAQAQKNPQPLQPGPMPAAGAVNPQRMAAAKIKPATATTPAAQAAQATTQAKVQTIPEPTAATAPIPEPQVQPTGPSYNVPTQTVPQTNVGGVKSVQQPSTMAMPKQGPATPMPTKPFQAPVPKTAEQAMAEFNQKTQRRQQSQLQRTEKMVWQAVQQRLANGGKMMPNEQAMIADIIKKYGEDPFGTGKIGAGTSTPPIETPAPTKKRDMSVGNASKQFTKDIEKLQKNNTLTSDQFNAEVDKLVKKYEIVTTKKQIRVYDEAYDAAIAEGKDVESARRAGNKALQRNGLPPMFSNQTKGRLKPKDTDKQETAMAQAWFDDTIKNADKQTKDMYNELLDIYNGDVGQLYRDISAKQAGKTTGKSFFEEPLDTTPKGKAPPGTMSMMTDEPSPTSKNIKEINTTPFGDNMDANYEYAMHKLKNSKEAFTGTYKKGNAEYQLSISDLPRGDVYIIKNGKLSNGDEWRTVDSPITKFKQLTTKVNDKEVQIHVDYTPETNNIEKITVWDLLQEKLNETPGNSRKNPVLYEHTTKRNHLIGNKEYYKDIEPIIDNALKGK
jgi:hypothetical protein